MRPNPEIWERVEAFWKVVQAKYGTPLHSHFELADRTWPGKKIDTPKRWVPVCLRDGNQALENPMTVAQKLEYFQILVDMWFKEIEVGFPSASEEDFNFVRRLIEDDLIPDDVTIQVLVQSKKELIDKTRQALDWAKNVIVHLYNSTSETQRKIVFWHWKKENTQLAVDGVKMIKNAFVDFHWEVTLQYSPESFTWTEVEYARDICRAVLQEWNGFRGNEVIINLPSTVENSTPDVYADKIEWMIRELKYNRTDTNQAVNIIISLHTHNDRGTGVAAAELAIKAWADRVEWTLFGNGERAGNVALEILALNMVSQWVSPWLDLSTIGEIAEKVTRITWMPIPPRHPYMWTLVHTAFSGSHQDAIRKCFEANKGSMIWENAYLPIDPQDIWLEYTPIRINSQSWKGGVTFIVEEAWYAIPKKMQPFIGKVIQAFSEDVKREVKSEEVVHLFQQNFVNVWWDYDTEGFQYKENIWNKWIVEQCVEFLAEKYGVAIIIKEWHGDSKTQGTGWVAVNFFEVEIDGKTFFWVGEDTDIARSIQKWIISALNIWNMYTQNTQA